jgi:integrase
MRWEDVDFRRKTIVFHRSVVAVPGGVEERGTKTGEGRSLAIGPKAAKLLREHEARCKDRAKKCNATVEPSAYVFSPDAAGRKPYNPHPITRTFFAACEDAGVPRMRLHDLRHHSATLLKNGAAVGEMMDHHGWRTVEMVNRYRHLLEAKDAEAARALENA